MPPRIQDLIDRLASLNTHDGKLLKLLQDLARGPPQRMAILVACGNSAVAAGSR
ncbi:hypothetical protein [Lichenifustis flavocetrariae]|uniref:Uncharacterized protein n=1 Tax=Lichenifustis flavocetrariae TaxID=2949735 RepID=A0AA41YYP6_9HYPH|nr:hypothetical protein [Lichenifustis flavocetrariae]MCW6509652.1 hypothetical protein [Lichenifustis flavocetrariae]